MDNQELNGRPDIEPERALEDEVNERINRTVKGLIEAEPKKSPGIKDELFEWAEMAAQVLITIVLVFIFIVRNTGVHGISMVPTLHDGDAVIISNLLYAPKNGDIVVLTKYGFEPIPGQVLPIVKRVVATSGQTVDIDFDAHTVSVDGVELDEPYINEPTENRGDVAFPATVPEGYIFVMGDNRNRSTDSRWSDVGMIDTRMVLGKVLIKIPISGIFGSDE